MPTHAVAGAGADAGGLAALVPRERRRYVPLDSRSRATVWNGTDRALLCRFCDVPALPVEHWPGRPWLTVLDGLTVPPQTLRGGRSWRPLLRFNRPQSGGWLLVLRCRWS